jgi:hypothetical protein
LCKISPQSPHSYKEKTGKHAGACKGPGPLWRGARDKHIDDGKELGGTIAEHFQKVNEIGRKSRLAIIGLAR